MHCDRLDSQQNWKQFKTTKLKFFLCIRNNINNDSPFFWIISTFLVIVYFYTAVLLPLLTVSKGSEYFFHHGNMQLAINVFWWFSFYFNKSEKYPNLTFQKVSFIFSSTFFTLCIYIIICAICLHAMRSSHSEDSLVETEICLPRLQPEMLLQPLAKDLCGLESSLLDL